MLIKRKIQSEEILEVPVPAYFKDELGHFLWCINGDENIISISRAQITVWLKGTPAYDITLREVCSGVEVSANEFEAAYHSVMQVIEKAVESVLIHQH